MLCQSEEFFISSLESWRKSQQLDRFILVGHSLGGYLATRYALRYPEHVQKLILVSPAGVTDRPDDWEHKMSERSPRLVRTIRYLWGLNVTPMMLIRAVGPYGPSLVQRYADRRFANLDPVELQRLRDYFYHINVRKGSGEFALNTVLSFGAWARRPLMPSFANLRVPTAFLYGSHDWMDSTGGVRAASIIPGGANVHVVSQSGHHLYMENVPEFNETFVSEILTA